MRPIQSPADLTPGAAIHHPAFGFARLRALHEDRVELDWERPSAHLPAEVQLSSVTRSYVLCVPGGFFDRALNNAARVREQLLSTPGDALLDLIDDLGGPQRVRDIMDWCVGRDLFNAKTFVRWWGTNEGLLRADPRLVVDGEWVRRSDAELQAPLRIAQLEPGLVEAEKDTTFDAADDVFAIEDLDALHDASLASVAPLERTLLTELRPPGRTFVETGLAVAAAIVSAEEWTTPAVPDALHTWVLPDGSVELSRGDARRAPMDAAVHLLIEAFTGRAVPPGCSPADVISHLRAVIDGAPPSSFGPLLAALHPDPASRPDARAWMAMWEAASDAERARAARPPDESRISVGFDSHIGKVKLLQSQTNQDCLYIGTRGASSLLVVADGISVSDAGRGELASRLVASALGRLWENIGNAPISPRRLLDRSLHLANRTVCERALRIAGGDLSGRMPMGTTVVAALVQGNQVHLSWLGDSRAYLLGPWGASQLTSDDNVSGERYIAWCGGFARSWGPAGHALTRYVGHFDTSWAPAPLPAHHTRFVLMPGERVVLCSDGVTDYIDSHEGGVAAKLLETLRIPDAEEAARHIVSQANRAGGGDNTSAVVFNLKD